METSQAVSPGERDRRVSRLLDDQRRVLERIASGAPLEDVLLTLVQLVEARADGMRCGVLLADVGETHLRFAAAPSFPEGFKGGMEPQLIIAEDVASCGAAAFLKEPVYARDALTERRWARFRDLAQRFGVRAAWSTPILGDDNRVLGTFAMTYGEPRLPAPEHIELIDMAVQMARVAIEAKADDDLLRTTFDDALTPLFVSDMDHRVVRANRAFAAALGYAPAELRGRRLIDITESFDPAGLVKEVLAGKHAASDRRYRRRDGRTLWTRERSSARFDEKGAPRYVVTRVDHLSEVDPLVELSPREREVMQLVVAGRTSKEIAGKLGVSPASVDTYRSRLMLKLRVENLPALVRFAIRHRIATL